MVMNDGDGTLEQEGTGGVGEDGQIKSYCQ